MQEQAICKAIEKQHKAKLALDACAAAFSNPALFNSCWGDFLLAHNGVFIALEQGAKGCGKSEPWFGSKKNERRKDPLLDYLHKARNADEHGIDTVIGVSNEISFKSADKEEMLIDYDPEREIKLVISAGIPPVVTRKQKVILIQVIDTKHGNKFDPPTSHLGQSLTDISPLGVAKIAMKYCDALIEEADTKLPKHG